MPTSELDAPAAYLAARDRALRTTEALILAEGQVKALEAELTEVRAERDRYAAEARRSVEARMRRRVRDRARRARGRIEAEGVEDEDADPVGYTGAVGQAD